MEDTNLTNYVSISCPPRPYLLFSPRLSEKSWLELKSLYPTTGETTNFQSSLGVLLLLRQSPPVEGHAYADDDAGGVAQAEDIHGINRK